MESKIYLAYHKEYPTPHSECLIPFDVRGKELPHSLFSELSMIHELLCYNSLHTEYMGVAHYRRMFQTEYFKNYISDKVYDGFEYGKETRPFLNYSDTHHKAVFSRFNSVLGDNDILVLDTFKKSRKDALNSLVEIGWLSQVAVDEFFKYISRKLPREQFEIVYYTLKEDKEHYANNIMYSRKEVFLEYWHWVMDIILGYYIHMNDFIEHQTPRMFGYFAEYLMKPCISIHGWKTKTERSICLK